MYLMCAWPWPAAGGAAGGQLMPPSARSLENSGSPSARVRCSSFAWPPVSHCSHLSILLLSKHLKSLPFPSFSSIVPHQVLAPTSSSAPASPHERPHLSSHEDWGILQGAGSVGPGGPPSPRTSGPRHGQLPPRRMVWEQASGLLPRAGQLHFPALGSLYTAYRGVTTERFYEHPSAGYRLEGFFHAHCLRAFSPGAFPT